MLSQSGTRCPRIAGGNLSPSHVGGHGLVDMVANSQIGTPQPSMDSRALRWYALFLGISGLWVLLPWLAPVLMHARLDGPARVIYAFYSVQCHQLPERSFFLFGPQPMVSLSQVRLAWRDTLDPLILRQFVGTPSTGYKVAWSDRMVSMYTSIPIAAAIWLPFRRRIRRLPMWAFVLLTLPIVIDGGTHMLSDLSGIGQGFRYTNLWLSELTGAILPTSFYVGDALGSFNSWMRLLTGLVFGVAAVWAVLPRIQATFEEPGAPGTLPIPSKGDLL